MPEHPSAFCPKLRPLDIRRVKDGNQAYFVLRDPSGLTGTQLLVPEGLGPLLALFDGTRDVAALCSAFQLRGGIGLPVEHVQRIVDQLGDALMLDDHRFGAAQRAAIDAYRSAPFRPLALAGKVYPSDPQELRQTFAAHCNGGSPAALTAAPPSGRVVGVVSPHIDYQRGALVYAGVWRQAAEAIADVDLVIVFGTDHSGGAGRLTLTRQSYATPLGVLPTERDVVDALAKELGEDAFTEEFHHRNEHSVELAVTWLHFFLGARSCPVVPILCGSFHEFVQGQADPETYEPFARTMHVLSQAISGKRALVVAAADLAHVGPVFGDPAPLGSPHRAALRAADDMLLESVCRGDAREFFRQIRQERDSRKVCGMPPIYLALRLLGQVQGAVTGYDQCPADSDGGSWVSIAGVVLHQASQATVAPAPG